MCFKLEHSWLKFNYYFFYLFDLIQMRNGRVLVALLVFPSVVNDISIF